jgi:hypothetical protein
MRWGQPTRLAPLPVCPGLGTTAVGALVRTSDADIQVLVAFETDGTALGVCDISTDVDRIAEYAEASDAIAGTAFSAGVAGLGNIQREADIEPEDIDALFVCSAFVSVRTLSHADACG